jgi:hypothetical protein
VTVLGEGHSLLPACRTNLDRGGGGTVAATGLAAVGVGAAVNEGG